VLPGHERWFPSRGTSVPVAVVLPLLLLLLLGAVLPACNVAEAKIYNLKQLHDPDSRHRYNAALEGDFEYVIRHELFGLFSHEGATLADKDVSKVEAPADDCLENLIELEGIDSGDPAVAGEKVEWFARLAVEDPWQLSRQRAVLALASVGARLQAGLPSGLGSDQTPADADAVGTVLTPLVKALREVLTGEGADRVTSKAQLEKACADVRALDYDMSGARRALAVVVTVQRTAGTRNPDTAPLSELSLDLQRLCVRRALARAIDDPEPIVSAAALSSTARIGGRVAIDTVLFDRTRRLLNDPNAPPEVLISIADTLVATGPLPEGGAQGTRTRDEWLGALYALATRRPEEDVRVHAMIALSRLSGSGFASLHEEDWQEWWTAHVKAHAVEAKSSGGASR
jgi:hypothetical protein